MTTTVIVTVELDMVKDADYKGEVTKSDMQRIAQNYVYSALNCMENSCNDYSEQEKAGPSGYSIAGSSAIGQKSEPAEQEQPEK